MKVPKGLFLGSFEADSCRVAVYLWSRVLLVVLYGVYTHRSFFAVERGEAGVGHFGFKEAFHFCSHSNIILRFRKSFLAFRGSVTRSDFRRRCGFVTVGVIRLRGGSSRVHLPVFFHLSFFIRALKGRCYTKNV